MKSRNSFNRPLHPLRNLGFFVELYILYFLIAFRLRRQGLKKTVEQCTTISPSSRRLSEVGEAELVTLTRDLTRKVLVWHVLPASCVPGSLLTCWFLARRGIKADFTITVRPYPFMAHAVAYWRDVPLTEPPPAWSLPEKYVSLMRK
jgi:hypothetical protein